MFSNIPVYGVEETSIEENDWESLVKQYQEKPEQQESAENESSSSA